MSSHKRTRVNPQKVKENAERGGQGTFLQLPDGVETWSFPDKEDTYKLDVVPYEITADGHPDDVKPGNIWYKREFSVHFKVGGTRSIVCPGSIGQKCPVCLDWQKLKKKYGDKPSKDEEEIINAVKPKRMLAMNMLDPTDPRRRRVFVYGSGKFWSFKGGGLDKELRDPKNEKYLSFFDVVDGRGRTLEVRMSKESFDGGRSFFQASKFNFEKRKDMDEDKTIKASVDLDKALIVLPYEKIAELHDSGGGPAEKKEAEGSESTSTSSSGSESGSGSGSSSASGSGSGSESGSASSSASGSSSAAASSSSAPASSAKSSESSKSSSASAASSAKESKHSHKHSKEEKPKKDEKKPEKSDKKKGKH